MNEQTPFLLAEHTTTKVGGPAAKTILCRTAAEIVAAVQAADSAGEQVLLLGGGSNLLVSDAPLEQTVIKLANTGYDLGGSGPDDVELNVLPLAGEAEGEKVIVTAQAGQNWDDFVAATVDSGLSGLEALSGIPGAVGATPVQNVGAYGTEVAQVLTRVRVYDREERQERWFSNAQLEFSYRDSLIKRSTTIPGSPRYVVLQAEFELTRDQLSAPIRYAELAKHLNVQVGERAPAADVRTMVLALRAGKGMVLNPADHDTWSTGSFFTNPIVAPEVAETLPADAPRFPAEGEKVKLSAGWLIQQAGFDKGFKLTDAASLSTKHTLALTNRGGACTEDLLQLARHVRDGVQTRFGITLVPEPLLIGCSLD